MRKNACPILASGLLLVALSGCSGGSSHSAELSSAFRDCVAAQPNVRADTPTIAILGQVGPKLSDYDRDIASVVGASKVTKARVIVNGVSDNTTAPNLLSNVVMVGEGNN